MQLDDLKTEVERGAIDTVLLAFTDMQGRLQGKRLTAEFFLDSVVHHGAEGCNYLLAVDVDMNTVDGYAMSSWELGYGDFEMKPDMDTLAPVPWHLSDRKRLSSCRDDAQNRLIRPPAPRPMIRGALLCDLSSPAPAYWP